MGNNSFGTFFTITTWGESHGPAMGVVIDGCPANVPISEEEINRALSRRAPGQSTFTSPRKEADRAEILSGTFEGKTTGAPLSIMIKNHNGDPEAYEPIKNILRPGHANYTFLKKYGTFDYRGGGRASGRETVCRVAAGAIAKKILEKEGIKIVAYIKQIGSVYATISSLEEIEPPFFCPDKEAEKKMAELIEMIKEEGDSIGGIVEWQAFSLPPGLGDPVYEKLEAKLAHAMMTIPAVKGVEIGAGFEAVTMKGSEHNDLFIVESGQIQTKTNHAGGILGGISTGMPLLGRVAFKPTSSIMRGQKTVTVTGEETLFQLPAGSRHDPCIALRGVPVVEAMAALVLVDLFLSHTRPHNKSTTHTTTTTTAQTH